MELSFQPVLRPGRLKPELRTHRKDQENAEVIPGSARILRALLIIAKPSARWKRALPGKCSSVVSSLVSFLTALSDYKESGARRTIMRVISSVLGAPDKKAWRSCRQEAPKACGVKADPRCRRLQIRSVPYSAPLRFLASESPSVYKNSRSPGDSWNCWTS